MRYVIVSVVHGEGGDFNNDLRREIFNKFKAKSSKLPAHFTIKAPFEVEDEIKEIDGKNKIIHVTISSKKIRDIYNELWDYVNEYPCNFNCSFDNVTIYNWQDNTWKVHKEYAFNE